MGLCLVKSFMVGVLIAVTWSEKIAASCLVGAGPSQLGWKSCQSKDKTDLGISIPRDDMTS